jgi:hypothetical protein
MGVRGPIPKRSDEGHPKTIAKKNRAGIDHIDALKVSDVFIPDPDPEWHEIARMLWDATKESAFIRFYEPSDWVVLYFTCENVSHFCHSSRRSSTAMAAINQMLTSLLLTEGDRRRVQIEIQRASEEQLESAGVTAMAAWVKERQAK